MPRASNPSLPDMFEYLRQFEGKTAVESLQDLGLLPKCMLCDKCKISISKLSSYLQWIDGVCFTCTACRIRYSIRKGTFFDKSKLSLHQIMCLVLFFVAEVPLVTTSQLLRLSSTTVVDWFTFCREVCIFTQGQQGQIGGPGVEVQIDESVMFKRKYHCGRLVPQRWVFGGYCVSQKKGFLVEVPNRSERVLLAEIDRYICPGSIIVSDCWLGYQHLANRGWQHKTVNHSLQFVDPSTKVCTNGVEGFWSVIKRMLNGFICLIDRQAEVYFWEQRIPERYAYRRAGLPIKSRLEL